MKPDLKNQTLLPSLGRVWKRSFLFLYSASSTCKSSFVSIEPYSENTGGLRSCVARAQAGIASRVEEEDEKEAGVAASKCLRRSRVGVATSESRHEPRKNTKEAGVGVSSIWGGFRNAKRNVDTNSIEKMTMRIDIQAINDDSWCEGHVEMRHTNITIICEKDNKLRKDKIGEGENDEGMIIMDKLGR
ncbi:hypothetical protein Fmac_032454 [Flemingia macrophylla]|uniref:Uncharacterized protein n=1 Tax=Flemingia macrophylla TaxID=520843 RepID=A0ABD1L5E7_9FABA